MLNKLYTYNNWATGLLISSLAGSPGEVPPLSLKLLSHIVNAQCIWASRILSLESSVSVWDLHSLETCEDLFRKSSLQLSECLKIDHGQKITYKTFSGQSYVNTVEEILMHVFNHGTYHRAQIATDMRCNGLLPVNTDYITYVRT